MALKFKVHGFTADFVNHTKKILVWLDGCRWHGCIKHSDGKYKYKHLKDKAMVKRAKSEGWKAFRFWEHDVLFNFEKIKLILK